MTGAGRQGVPVTATPAMQPRPRGPGRHGERRSRASGIDCVNAAAPKRHRPPVAMSRPVIASRPRSRVVGPHRVSERRHERSCQDQPNRRGRPPAGFDREPNQHDWQQEEPHVHGHVESERLDDTADKSRANDANPHYRQGEHHTDQRRSRDHFRPAGGQGPRQQYEGNCENQQRPSGELAASPTGSHGVMGGRKSYRWSWRMVHSAPSTSPHGQAPAQRCHDAAYISVPDATSSTPTPTLSTRSAMLSPFSQPPVCDGPMLLGKGGSMVGPIEVCGRAVHVH